MLKNLKTSTKLYLLVVVMSLFTLWMSFLGLNGMKTMDINSKAIHYDRILPIYHLTHTRFQYINVILNTVEMTENHTVNNKWAVNKIESAEQEIQKNWELYLKTNFTPEEDILVKQTQLQKEKADKAIGELKNALLTEQKTMNNELAGENLVVLINPVIQNLNNLVDLQIRISNQLYEQNDALYITNKKKFYFLIIVSFFLSAFIAHYLIKDTKTHILELSQSKEKLSESEEKYRYLFQNNPACIIIWDLETLKILEVNNEIIKRYGYTEKEWQNMSVFDYRPVSDHPKIKSFAQEALTSEQKVLKGTWTHLRKDGQELLMKISSHKIFYNGHKAILSLANDITEQEKSALAYKKSEEKYRALIENIDDAILLINDNLEVFYQSPSAEKIVGYTIEDRKGKKVTDFVHPDDREICRIQYEEAMAKPGIHTKSEYRTLHKNGYYIWIEIFIMNLKDNESIQSYVVVYRDITSRKQLEEQQMLMSSIVNSSYDAIVSKNMDNIITSWNIGAEKILGYTAQEMIGESIYKIIPNNLKDEELHFQNAILSGKSINHFETKRIRKDSQVIDVSIVVSPIIDVKGNVIGASKILRDITEKKKAEQELIAHNKTLSEIAFLQSHIVRRPVANVLGIIRLLDLQNPAAEENIELIPLLEVASKELDAVITQIVEKTNELNKQELKNT